MIKQKQNKKARLINIKLKLINRLAEQKKISNLNVPLIEGVYFKVKTQKKISEERERKLIMKRKLKV